MILLGEMHERSLFCEKSGEACSFLRGKLVKMAY